MITVGLKFDANQDAQMENEDAFKPANLYAGQRINLSEVLASATPVTAPYLIEHAQEIYRLVFEAFIAGVDHGRKNPVEKKYNWKSTGPGGCDSHNIEHPCGRCLEGK